MSNKIKTWLGIEKIKLNIYDISLLLLPIIIWFSYKPVIYFGDYSGMHLELSITLIALVIFAFINIPLVFKNIRTLAKHPTVIISALFILFCAVSLFWTLNLARGILTLGIICLLFIAFLAILANLKTKKLIPALSKILIISAVVISVFSWLQMIGDVIGLSSDVTLLCKGCVSSMFGFPRLTAFAIEPQFFGSLLLAPIMILAWKLITKRSAISEKVMFVFLMATMILTLSRGAIYALVIGLIFMVVFAVIKRLFHNSREMFKMVGFSVAGVLLALFTQGCLAALNPVVNETFYGAVTKSVHQLSLGVIDLRPSAQEEITDETTSETDEMSPHFDGYVENSTNERLSLSDMAIGAWRNNVPRIFFGAGLGSAGYAMNEEYPSAIGKTEIVQNEYFEVLLELGLIGFVLFLLRTAGFIMSVRKNGMSIAIIIAFLVQWIFFSGLPNALHIYLVLAVLYTYQSATIPLKLSKRRIKK